MESFAIYLIKVNIALIVLYAFYKLSFSKDTFFRLRRIMLLLICVTSLIYPLIDFSGWTDEYAIGETFTTVYNKLLPEVLVTTAVPVATTEVEGTTWQAGTWLWIIYGLGIGMLLLRNLLEVSKIHHSLACSQRYSLKGVPVYQSEDVGEPCSFFHWIFINPMQYSDKEIDEILIHEQTHVRELHSLDIILVQLVILLCWFNPFSWLIRSEIRMNHEYLECMKSFLSVLLSGTPAQVKPLIPSAENGLFSRQMFYYMPSITEWVNQFDLSDEDYDSRFTGWGKQWKTFIEWLGASVNLIQLKLSEEQKIRFNERFAQLFGHAGFTHGGAMRSTVARIAINICRILSVVALLRATEKLLPPHKTIFNSQFSIFKCPGLSPSDDIPEENVRDGIVPKLDLTATEADFEAVLNLTEPLYRHACHILSILPATDVQQREPTPQEALFDALPLAFNRQEALHEAKRIGMGTDTLDSHLRRMLEKGVIQKNARGEYIFTAKQRQTPQSPL